MRFEHLIEINPSGFGVIQPFTREELWRGLMVRVYEPEALPLGPDSCDWTDEPTHAEPAGAEAVRRHLRFGAVEIHDRVWLEPMRRIVFTPDEQPDMPSVVLTLTLEEPRPGILWLRFIYESTRSLTPEEAYYDGFRRSAWLANDQDMVRTLRVWLGQGRLSAPGAAGH